MRPSTFQKMFAGELAELEKPRTRGGITLIGVLKVALLACLIALAFVSLCMGFV